MINEQPGRQTDNKPSSQAANQHNRQRYNCAHFNYYLPPLGIKSPKLKQNKRSTPSPATPTIQQPRRGPNKKLISYRNAAAIDDDPGETHKLVSIWQLLFKSIL